MPPAIQGLVHSEVRRRKRRATAKMESALSRVRDAMIVLQNSANELAVIYGEMEMKDAEKAANAIVNSLRTRELYTVDELCIQDDVLAKFNALPED